MSGVNIKRAFDTPPPPSEPPPENIEQNDFAKELSKGPQNTILVSDDTSIFDPDNIHQMSEIWVKCSDVLKQFKRNSVGIKIQSKDGKYSIHDSKGTLIVDSLNPIDACAFKLLDRYRLLVNSYKTMDFENPTDFFHQIESNREYHARQLVCLYISEDIEINIDDLENTTLEGLNEIDLYLYEKNKSQSADVYIKVWLLNAIMISLGNWEVDSSLFKKQYIDAIMAKDVSSLPSHIRMLSKVVKETEGDIKKLYPQTVLMNYSHFYPVVLYHTNKDPIAENKRSSSQTTAVNPESGIKLSRINEERQTKQLGENPV